MKKLVITLILLFSLAGCQTFKPEKIDQLAGTMQELSVLNIQSFNYNGFWTDIKVSVVSNDDGTETVSYDIHSKYPGGPGGALIYTRKDLDWVPPPEPEQESEVAPAEPTTD